MGPLEATKPWNTAGVEGVYRFLKRACRVLSGNISDEKMSADLARSVHAAVKKVTNDIESFGFNTAISALMVLLNEFAKLQSLPREAAETFTLLLAPFAPHLSEELWQELGHQDSLAYEPWPQWDESLLKVSEQEILVQVLGKPKARLMMPVGCDEETARKIVLADPVVQETLAGREIRKFIMVPGRLINLVV
jgi:leucyl-tRNA synthetase